MSARNTRNFEVRHEQIIAAECVLCELQRERVWITREYIFYLRDLFIKSEIYLKINLMY